MAIDRRGLIGAGVGLALGGSAQAQTHSQAAPHPAPPPVQWPPAETFALWPGSPPGSPIALPKPTSERNGYQGAELWLRGVARPFVAVYRPAKPDGRAVLSIPGGGYGFLSVSNEGIDVAARLNPQGITVFVLAYRLPGDGWANRADVPLQDAQRAMRLIRSRATSWGIDPARVGILGFSAGGHLGGMLSVGHADKLYAPVDAADALSARPDWSGLVYPVMSFATAGLNSKSAGMLLGEDRDPALLARYTPLDRIDAKTPPIFLAHAIDDPIVPIQQSLATIDACRKAGVPVEAYLLEKGGHGFGAMHLPAGASGLLWTDLYARWTAKH